MIRRPARTAVLAVVFLGWALSALVFAGPAAARALYLGPSGNDSGNSCLSAALPCRSFDAAYKVAQAGDVVELATGTYGSQTIYNQSSRTAGPNVVFRPAPLASVTVGSVNVWASYVTLDGFKAVDVTVRPEDNPNRPTTVKSVVLRNLDARNFNIFSATDVQVLGGDYGPASSCGGPYGGGNNSIRKLTDVNPSNIVIDGVAIHDVQSYDLGPCHTEGLAIFAGTNLIVRNSRFYGNSVYDIFMQGNSGPISGRHVREQLVRDACRDQRPDERHDRGVVGRQLQPHASATTPSTAGSRWTTTARIPRTATSSSPATSACCRTTAARWRGVSFSYNVWKGHKCGATDVNLGGAAMPYVNAANSSAQNYHLTGGPAEDLIPASSAMPSRDIDGDARPQNGAGDAGADEISDGR